MPLLESFKVDHTKMKAPELTLDESLIKVVE